MWLVGPGPVSFLFSRAAISCCTEILPPLSLMRSYGLSGHPLNSWWKNEVLVKGFFQLDSSAKISRPGCFSPVKAMMWFRGTGSHPRIASLLPTTCQGCLTFYQGSSLWDRIFLVLGVLSHLERIWERIEDCKWKSMTYSPNMWLIVNLLIWFELCIYFVNCHWGAGHKRM